MIIDTINHNLKSQHCIHLEASYPYYLCVERIKTLKNISELYEIRWIENWNRPLYIVFIGINL
jgi:hypothetical protein